MKKKRKTPISDFAAYEEAARFFDTHDTTTLAGVELGWKTLYECELAAGKRKKEKEEVHVTARSKSGHDAHRAPSIQGDCLRR